MIEKIGGIITLCVAWGCFIGMCIEAHLEQNIYEEVSFGITAILLLVLKKE